MGGTLNIDLQRGLGAPGPGRVVLPDRLPGRVRRRRRRCTRSRRPVTSSRPLLASGQPQISADGKTVTVHIKSGFKFSAAAQPGGHLGRRRLRVPADVQPERPERLRAPATSRSSAPTSPPASRSRESDAEQDDDRVPPDQELRRHVRRGAVAARHRAGAGVATRPSSTRAARRSTTPTRRVQAFSGPYIIKSYSAGRSITLVRNPLEPPSSTASARRTPTRSCGTPAPTRPSPPARRSTARTC